MTRRLLRGCWRLGAQVCCAWRGHNTLLCIEPRRLWVWCVSCGFESTGLPCEPTWQLVPPEGRR